MGAFDGGVLGGVRGGDGVKIATVRLMAAETFEPFAFVFFEGVVVESFAARETVVRHAQVACQGSDHMVMPIMQQQIQFRIIVVGARRWINDGIALIGGHHHDAIGRHDNFELSNFP